MLNSKDLAYFFVAYCNQAGVSINSYKLQKLLYYAQAWYLVYFDKKMLFDERPQAWVNGPVYQTVYNHFKRKGRADQNIQIMGSLTEYSDKLNMTEEQKEFLHSLLAHYALMSHEQLIILTHKESPWNEARKGLDIFEPSQKEISIESMYAFYAKVRAKNNKTI
jgi:uncharacterized phage-associated protein